MNDEGNGVAYQKHRPEIAPKDGWQAADFHFRYKLFFYQQWAIYVTGASGLILPVTHHLRMVICRAKPLFQVSPQVCAVYNLL